MRLNVFLRLMLLASVMGHAAEQPVAKHLVVRISEGWWTLRPTAGPNNFSNCLVLTADGRLHLELRRQEFMDGRAVLTTYESLLDRTQIEQLRSILDKTEVSTLQSSIPPIV